jgi:hypothetical protein
VLLLLLKLTGRIHLLLLLQLLLLQLLLLLVVMQVGMIKGPRYLHRGPLVHWWLL